MSWFLWWGLLFTRKLLNQGLLLVKLKSSIRIFYGRHHDLVDCYGISVSQMTTDMFYLSYALSGFFLIHDISLTRLTWRVSLVEQELLTLPDHLSSSPVFGGVRVNPSLVLCVCFVDRCLSVLFWPLYFLSIYILRRLVTNVVSLSLSYKRYSIFFIRNSEVAFTNNRKSYDNIFP